MLRLSFPKPPIEYRSFTREEWDAYPKDHFDSSIRSWCRLHGFVQHVELGKAIPAKLPYRANGDSMEVAEDFLHLVQRRREKGSPR